MRTPLGMAAVLCRGGPAIRSSSPLGQSREPPMSTEPQEQASTGPSASACAITCTQPPTSERLHTPAFFEIGFMFRWFHASASRVLQLDDPVTAGPLSVATTDDGLRIRELASQSAACDPSPNVSASGAIGGRCGALGCRPSHLTCEHYRAQSRRSWADASSRASADHHPNTTES